MLMWVMSDRAIPRSYRMMQGFGVHTFRLVNARRRVAFCQVPLEAGRRHPLAGLGRGGQDLAAPTPTSTAATCGKRSRPARIPSGSSGCRSSPRRRPTASASTSSTRPRSSPRSWCRCAPVGRMVLDRNPDNFFAGDRAGRVLHGAHGPGHRLQQRSAAGRAHPLLRRHADLAARRAELPRDPDQLAARAGAQQPARRHASPGDPARPGRLRAELARRRLPVPGRRARASSPSRSR